MGSGLGASPLYTPLAGMLQMWRKSPMPRPNYY